VAAATAEAFERVIREQLDERDRKRRARLLDRQVYAEADTSCVAAIMQSVGYDAPEAAVKAVTRGRRTAAVNEAAAFGEVD
jgi:hypothetical protein